MPGRHIQPARFPGNAPVIESMKYKTAETFKRGALCLVDANGDLAECAADPTVVHAVALEGVASKPGWDAANSPTVITGRVQEVSVAMANRLTLFSMRAKDASNDPLTPTQTHVGEEYGVVKDADGIWILDTTEVTAKVFHIWDIDIPNKIFFCKFLEAVIQAG